MNPDEAMMPVQHLVDAVLEDMDGWVQPTDSRAYSVGLFALRLPEHKLWEALYVAKAHIPSGGMPGWKYFCGAAHTMIRELADERETKL